MRFSSSGAVIPRSRAGDRSPEELASSPLSILTLVFGTIPIGGPPLLPLDPRRFCAVATVNSFASAAALRLTLIMGGLLTMAQWRAKSHGVLLDKARVCRASGPRSSPDCPQPPLLPIAPGRNLRSTVRTTPARDRAHRGEKAWPTTSRLRRFLALRGASFRS